MWNAIAQAIQAQTGEPFEIHDRRSVSGGCINQGYAISNGQHTYFVKVNRPNQDAMFRAEQLGLKQMAATQTIRVPQPVTLGNTDEASFIVLEWLELGGSGGWETMGQNLAALHRSTGSDQFGWDMNNTIGSTPQINTWTDSWADFFAEERIGYQLRLAKRNGGSFPNSQQVVERVREILADHQPQPSLVHGDLWSGNAGCTTDSEPVIFDPAAYWGDREVDLAMTELFGRFPAGFYRGYEQAWPLSSGYSQRKTLYNLYHILNHFNLFGGGYGSQAQRMLNSIL